MTQDQFYMIRTGNRLFHGCAQAQPKLYTLGCAKASVKRFRKREQRTMDNWLRYGKSRGLAEPTPALIEIIPVSLTFGDPVLYD